jgi:hypothetical protein
MVALGTLSLLVALQAITQGGFWLHTVTANIQTYRFENVVDSGRRLAMSSAPVVLLSLGALRSTWRKGHRESQDARVARAVVGLLLVGALLSALTVGKVGSAVNHLLHLVAAIALLGGIAFAQATPIEPKTAGARSLPSRAATAILVLQVPWMLSFGMDLAERTDEKLRLGAEFRQLAEIVKLEPDPVLADEAAGMVVLGGHEMAVDPFDLTQLVHEGAATEEPLVSDLKAKRFGLVLVHEAPATSDSSVRERWTPRMLDAIHEAYEARGVLAWATLYRPRR